MRTCLGVRRVTLRTTTVVGGVILFLGLCGAVYSRQNAFAEGGVPVSGDDALVSSQFAGNTSLFRSKLGVSAYNIISDHGVSPTNEYVVYSPTPSALLAYDYAEASKSDAKPGLRLRLDGQSSDETTAGGQSCNNLNVDHSSANGYNGSMHARLIVSIFRGGSYRDAVYAYNKTTGFGEGERAICSDFTVPIPSDAFSYDSYTKMYRAYFKTDFQYKYAATATNTGTWTSDYGSSTRLDGKGARLEHDWAVSTGGLLSYGQPGAGFSGGDPAMTTVISRTGINPPDSDSNSAHVDSTPSARYPFGLPCDVDSAQRLRVHLYDFDNGPLDGGDTSVRNTVGFYIFKKAPGDARYSSISLIDSASPESVSIAGRGATSQGGHYFQPADGTQTTIEINLSLQPRVKYYIAFAYFNSPIRNFYKIGIPTDGIYGTANFTCDDWGTDGSVSPTNTAGDAISTIVPGNTIRFNYSLWNTGMTQSQPITYTPGGKPQVGGRVFAAGERVTDAEDVFVPIDLDHRNGKQICRDLVWTPTAYNNSGTSSRSGCVRVSYPYSLNPSVTAPSSATIGGTVEFGGIGLDNTTPYYSNDARWTVYRFIVPAGNTAFSSGTATRESSNASDYGCSRYASLFGVAGCRRVTNGSSDSFVAGSTRFNGAELADGSTTTPVDDALSVGGKICYAVVIDQATYAGWPAPMYDPWYREKIACVAITKDPALHVDGGDVRTGGAFRSNDNVATTCKLARDANNDGANTPYGIYMHNYNSNTRGSYGRYGAFALGRIDAFGTQGAYYNNTAGSPSWGLLFGTSSYSSYGQHGFFYGGARRMINDDTFCFPNVTTLYQQATMMPSTSVDSTPLDIATASAIVTKRFDGNNQTLNVMSGSDLGVGKRVIVYVTQNSGASGNTITIRSNITYDQGGYANTSELPQVVVIAQGAINIHIDEAVTEVSGVYSTGGDIYTCGTYGGGVTQMTKNMCANKLTIKGALIASGKVVPYRTFGYDTLGDLDPAEEFQLTPETLLSDYDRARRLPTVTTDYVSELPTRL